MNILGGTIPADAGSMTLDDAAYLPRTPRDAAAAGIGFVHQELNLFPGLSIAENLFPTGFPRRGPWINRAALRLRATALLTQVGLKQCPETPVERLSAGERQLVEIAHALSFEARLLILGLFGLWSPRFLTGPNLTSILVQSAATAVVATGMTFVLLTASVDLSVGSLMFVAAVVAGKILAAGSLAVSGWGLPLALLAILGVGLLGGGSNALLITACSRLRRAVRNFRLGDPVSRAHAGG